MTESAGKTTMYSVGLGGYLSSRRPVSLVRSAVRSGEQINIIIVPFGSIETELVLGVSTVQKLVYGVISLGVFGLAPLVRQKVEAGLVETVEYGATSLLRALQAGARQQPYALSRTHPPFLGPFLDEDGLPRQEQVSQIPSWRPTVAYIHVPYADPQQRRAWVYGIGPDLIMAAAARKTHVTFDVAVEQPPRLPNIFTLPPHLITSLENRPFGAFPTHCYPLYGAYPPFYADYIDTFHGMSGEQWREQFISPSDEQFIRSAVEKQDRERLMNFGPAPDRHIAMHREELLTWLDGK